MKVHSAYTTSHSRFSLESLWRCRFCSNPFEAEFVREFVEGLEGSLEDVIRSKAVTDKILEMWVRDNARHLHVKHYLNTRGNQGTYFLKHCMKNVFFIGGMGLKA